MINGAGTVDLLPQAPCSLILKL